MTAPRTQELGRFRLHTKEKFSLFPSEKCTTRTGTPPHAPLRGVLTTSLHAERRTSGGVSKRPVASWLQRGLPRAGLLDSWSYRFVMIGFPIWTFGVICGAIWGEHAWGRYWGWDPKETFAFITWVIFAIYLHARVTYGWKEKRAAIITVFGFAAILFTLYAVNLWIAGLHSYARA